MPSNISLSAGGGFNGSMNANGMVNGPNQQNVSNSGLQVNPIHWGNINFNPTGIRANNHAMVKGTGFNQIKGQHTNIWNIAGPFDNANYGNITGMNNFNFGAGVGAQMGTGKNYN